MKAEKTIAMLKEVRKNTTDPKMQKELDEKIKRLSDNKTVEK